MSWEVVEDYNKSASIRTNPNGRVGDRVKPITLKVAVYEGDDPAIQRPLSSIVHRTKWMSAGNGSGSFTRPGSTTRKLYRLVLRMPRLASKSRAYTVIDRAFYDDLILLQSTKFR
jgi:hypothetical protein